MKQRIVLDQFPPDERVAQLEGAVARLLTSLESQFPANEGFKHVSTQRLAKWAWPKGTQQSEKQLLASLPAGLRRRAWRRGIRVTRGLTWGLTIDVQTADADASAADLVVLAESPLAIIAAASGLVIGIVAAVVFYFATNFAGDNPRSLKLAVYGGIVAGAGLAGIAWLVTRPLEGLKRDALAALGAEIAQTLTPGAKQGAGG
jgi:hypothetical protein